METRSTRESARKVAGETDLDLDLNFRFHFRSLLLDPETSFRSGCSSPMSARSHRAHPPRCCRPSRKEVSIVLPTSRTRSCSHSVLSFLRAYPKSRELISGGKGEGKHCLIPEVLMRVHVDDVARSQTSTSAVSGRSEESFSSGWLIVGR